MRLTDASIAIRPRSPWEALDLGVLLACRHRRLLMLSWALLTLPIFALLSLLLWNSPSLAIFLFWWLKPAFERLPLHILSQALFAEPPTLGQALRQWPQLLKVQLLPSLLWRRLSLSRSFSLPVQQLEGLAGVDRQRRLAILHQRSGRAAHWLTLVGMHLEGALWIGLLTLFYLMVPQQVEVEWSWRRLIEAANGQWLWVEHLTNAFYALVLVFWEPIYVACGFTLYLNRRTELEAWDIELVLRNLRQRLAGLAPLLLIMSVGLGLLGVAPHSQAATQPNPFDSPRLVHQAVTSQAARADINQILEQPPFSNKQTLHRWRLDQPQDKAEKPADLGKLLEHPWLKWLGQAMEVVLWGAVVAMITLAVWRHRQWLQTFVNRRRPAAASQPQAPQQLWGLAVSVQSLPDDIADHARQLWASQPREALSLLYRGLLNRLLNDYRLPLHEADTEGQVLEKVAHLDNPALDAFSQVLTRHWQALAYGHRLPSDSVAMQLCNDWSALFAAKGPSA
ncbi:MULTISPECIES: DUF4129 domain-containing protein [unclassified Pseudomonas]|uniref:DUF4129 domain-containing protein n=1 Tax=unclassified Pseudomonas TaxID=196821 RepID=UPI00031C18C0|nr:DUF4129 domain-containing protein [Pseudomonas sp. M47T1]